MLLARSILETATLLSAKKRDMDAFSRNMAQLKPYYQSKSFSNLEESPMQYTILGLNLLRLLAGNQIADFHTELELIPTDMLDNTFINHPVLLEQYLMEGSYTKIIASRNEVASCSERAYPHLVTKQACKLFMFEENELVEFSKARGWKIEGDRIVFPEPEEEEEDKGGIPANKVIKRTLLYAKELERIV